MAEIIEMPKLSDTMTTGTLVKWLKQENDEVSSGDMIAEVETDKATMEVETFEDGVLLKQYVKEGDVAAIGSPICAIGEKGEEAPEVEMPEAPTEDEEGDSGEKESETSEEAASGDSKEQDSASPKEADSASGEEESGDAPTKKTDTADAARERASMPVQTPDNGERIKASPVARRVAVDKGVDLRNVKGTGPNGRIVKADVLKAAEAPQPATPAAGKSEEKRPEPAAVLEEKTVQVSNMRASIAKALVKSKTEAPHFYLQIEVDAAPLVALRQQINGSLAEVPAEQGGAKFTVNDFILKAAAEAVRRVPAINRSWEGDKIKQHGSVHLAFGVAIDDGLVTPVIRGAHGKSLRELAAEAKDLIGKARNRKLKPDEMSGSTLTVTNLGMFGISDFYGILNPPNAAILSVGATV